MSETSQSRTLPILGLLTLAIILFIVALNKQSLIPPAGWQEGWREVTPFQFPRRALAAAATDRHLYAVGGVDGGGQYVRPIEYAPILKDGQLGQWKTTTSLQEGRFYLAAVVHDGYLYALGGGGGELGDNNIPLASVERAKINPDGSLQPWQQHSYLSTPRRGLKASVVNNRLYAIGGYNGQFLKSIELLDITNPTPIGQWVIEPEQAKMDRYIHAAATMDNRLFLLGGHVEKDGPMSYGDVESASISTDGKLAPWQIAESRLLTPRFIASAFALENHLYLLGGHDGVRRLATVEMTTVSAKGKLRAWSPLKSLNHKRSATAAAITSNRVYIAGGMDDRGVLRSVEMAELGPNGKLGYVDNSATNTLPTIMPKSLHKEATSPLDVK